MWPDERVSERYMEAEKASTCQLQQISKISAQQGSRMTVAVVMCIMLEVERHWSWRVGAPVEASPEDLENRICKN